MSRVVDSDNPDFRPGDLISGLTGWEEYSLIYRPQQLRKIQHQDDIPLSFHVGLLGRQIFYPFLLLLLFICAGLKQSSIQFFTTS